MAFIYNIHYKEQMNVFVHTDSGSNWFDIVWNAHPQSPLTPHTIQYKTTQAKIK